MRITRAVAALGLLVLRAGSAPAQSPLPALYPLDQAHSEVAFSVRFMGLSRVRGTFGGVQGSVMYDSTDATRSSVTVIIRAGSINTGSTPRDTHLRSPDFFDVERFPFITYRSTEVRRDGDGFVIRGDLSMHGVRREVPVRFTRLHGRERDAWGNHRVGFEGRARINRRDFGIVGGAFWNSEFDPGRFAVADSVDIELTIEATQWNFENVRRVAPGKLSVQDTLLPVVETRGIAAALARYRELQRVARDRFDFSGDHLNTFGYLLLQRGRRREAVELFQLALEASPDDPNILDSLGEAWAALGDRPRAIAAYQRALDRDSTLTSASEMLRWLRAGR